MSTGETKKSKANQTLLIGLLAGAGLLGLLVCCGGAVGVYFLFFSGAGIVSEKLLGPSIAGKWEVTAKFPGGFDKRTWDFQRGGAGKLNIHAEVDGKAKDSTAYFDYKLIKGDPLILEMKLTKAEGDATDRMKREIGETVRFTAVQQRDVLRLTKQGRGDADTITLKRVR